MRPAVGSLFTSLYPTAHGAVGHGRTLSAEALTLAEAMRAEGYVTLAVQTNPFLRGPRTFAQGFDSYERMIGASGSRVVRRFKQELERLDPQKFFAYVHLMDVHLPYDAPESFRRMFEKGYDGSIFGADEIRLNDRTVAQTKRLTETDERHVIDLYDAGVREADSYVAEILEELEARGQLDSTIVVVTSDHGEELFDHSSFEHGHSVYGEITRVPLIINHTGLPRETRVGQLVRHIDILPTLLGLMDLPLPPGLMGRDLRPAIADPSLDWQLPGFTETMLYGPPQFSLEQGQ